MKIIHITPYYPPHMGGLEKTVKELAERSASKGNNVTVFTSNKVKNDENSLVKIKSLKSINLPGMPVLMLTLPFNILSKVNSDTIVHIHYVLNVSMDFGILFSKLKNAKVITHIHTDPLPTKTLGFLNPSYKKIFWENILPLSNKIICPTKEYAAIFIKNYNISNSKISVIPPGINISQFKFMDKQNVQFPVNILFVGRLDSKKNVLLLLKAFLLFKKQYNAKIHIVGNGEEKNKIINFIEKEKLENDVILYGEVPNEHINEIYSICDIFVMPSTNESFGIVYLEAMASGIPIIASDIPGAQWLRDCSLLVKPTPSDIFKAMETLVENPTLRKKIIKKSNESVIKYDWNSIINKVLNLYKTVL